MATPPHSLDRDAEATGPTHLHIRSSTSSETLSRRNDPPPAMPEETATHDFYFLPIPMRLRHDPTKPPHFSLLLNAMFGLASTFCKSPVSLDQCKAK